MFKSEIEGGKISKKLSVAKAAKDEYDNAVQKCETIAA
jgi:hypothetical protein